MKWFKVFHSDARYESPIEVEALDELNAQFQAYSQYPDIDSKTELRVQEFLPPIKPIFVRVHHGYITVNLIPEIAEKLGYKEGDRLPTFEDFSHVVGTQNEFIVDEWFNRTGNEKPLNRMDAFNFMVSNYSN